MTDLTGMFYINGCWVPPHTAMAPHQIVNPATEEVIGTLATGSEQDVNLAVAAAVAAQDRWSDTPLSERIAILRRIASLFEARIDELAVAVTREMGCPISYSLSDQVPVVLDGLKSVIEVVEQFRFESISDGLLLAYDPIGVVGLITPWNWPLHQIAYKVFPALAAGCTMILKPSEYSPLSALLFAEIMQEAGVPPGVFNLVNGYGPVVGRALSQHPDVAMISFTGSIRAGAEVAKDAADTIKRVTQELGGKSANILLPGTDLEQAIGEGVDKCFMNTGQSCSAPTRLLVHSRDKAAAIQIAKRVAEAMRVGDPEDPQSELGPVVNAQQFARIDAMLETAERQGATIACGGRGRPDHLDRGYFVKATVLSDVAPWMEMAQEEAFGPILSIMTYETVDEAVKIANGTRYGLMAFVSGPEAEAKAVARRLRAGAVVVNGTHLTTKIPFGGYKQSGNGREGGIFGVKEYLELKVILETP